MASKKPVLNMVKEINGKPVDASGHIFLLIDIDNFEAPLHIEKVFGIVSRETNIVLKFRLIAHEDIPDDSDGDIYQGYCILFHISGSY